MDRLTSIEVFSTVVKEGGFSAAARRLGMSVTQVSSHVQALESRLGARLLHRTTRKVSLTETGRDYYERSSAILAELEEADRMVAATQSTPRGMVRLHVHPSFMPFFAPVIGEYLDRFSEISADITTGERMVDLIDERYDLVLRPTLPPASGFICRKLLGWRHLICCSPRYLETHRAPLHPDELVDHNCLVYAPGPLGHEWRFEPSGGGFITVRVCGNLVSNNSDLLLARVVAGSGILLAPGFVVRKDLLAGRLLQILNSFQPPEYVVNAIYPDRQRLPMKIRALLDLFIERWGKEGLIPN